MATMGSTDDYNMDNHVISQRKRRIRTVSVSESFLTTRQSTSKIHLYSLLYLLFLSLATAQNKRFDPEQEWQQDCYIPPPLKPEPVIEDLLGSCPQPLVSIDTANTTLLHYVALSHAPFLWFHPLERFTMSKVNVSNGNDKAQIMFGNDWIISNSLDSTTLLQTSRDVTLGLNKHLYYIQYKDLNSDNEESSSEHVRGAGFDSDGKSQASIYYNIEQDSYGIWIINYYFYFSYRGEYTLGVVGNDKSGRVTYKLQVPPLGAHEGDWQGISVMVCPTLASTQPLAVNYFHDDHAVTTTYCTLGDCVFYKNSFNPVAFMSLDTHLPFPISSPNIYTHQFVGELNENTDDTEFFYNLQGVYRVEQTNYLGADGRYRYFEPNLDNVIKISKPSLIDPGSNDTSIDEYWQGFGGRWGGRALYNAQVADGTYQLGDPVCYSEDGKQPEACPNDSSYVYTLLMQLLGIEKSSSRNDIQNAITLRNLVSKWWRATAVGPRGPATMARFSRWIAGEIVPIRNSYVGAVTSGDDFCQGLQSVNEEYISPIQSYDDASEGNRRNIGVGDHLYGMLILGIVMVVVNIIVMSRLSWISKPFVLLGFNEDTGQLIPPNMWLLFYLYKPAIVYTIFYVWTLAGLTVYFKGFSQLVETLGETSGIMLGSVENWSFVVAFAVIFIDTFMLVIIWFPAGNLWLQVKATYYELEGNTTKKAEMHHRVCCEGRLARIVFQIVYGVLFGGYLLAILCVFVGSIDLGMAYYALELCQERYGAVDGVCLDFSAWGILIKCGDEFNFFCQQWTTHQSVVTLWGSIIIISGHFYLLSSAGAASIMIRIVPSHLRMLPTRAQYVESLRYHQNKNRDAVYPTVIGGDVIMEEEVNNGGNEREPLTSNATAIVPRTGVRRSRSKRSSSKPDLNANDNAPLLPPATSTRKRSSSPRKRSSPTRKRSTSPSKRSSPTRKRSTSPRKRSTSPTKESRRNTETAMDVFSQSSPSILANYTNEDFSSEIAPLKRSDEKPLVRERTVDVILNNEQSAAPTMPRRHKSQDMPAISASSARSAEDNALLDRLGSRGKHKSRGRKTKSKSSRTIKTNGKPKDMSNSSLDVNIKDTSNSSDDVVNEAPVIIQDVDVTPTTTQKSPTTSAINEQQAISPSDQADTDNQPSSQPTKLE